MVSRRSWYFFLFSFLFLSFSLLFQNCGNSFEAYQSAHTGSSLSSTNTPLNTDRDLNGNLIEIDINAPLSIYAVDSAFVENDQLVAVIRVNKVDSEDIDVAWNTSEGIAVAGTHYIEGSSTVTIPAGEEFAKVYISLLKSENIDITFQLNIISTSKGVIARSSAALQVPAGAVSTGIPEFNFVKPQYKKIDSGSGKTCGITPLDRVECWSDGIPAVVPNLQKVMDIFVDGTESCAISDQGSVHCWTSIASIPLEKANLQGSKQLTFGSRHMCAITAQNTIVCQGDNRSGELGNNSTVDSDTLVAVLNLSGVKQISSGTNHTCAITAQDTVACWGDNSRGQLGNNSRTDSSVPVAVSNLAGVKQISSSGTNTCAITAQDTVVCWGSQDFGQLGNNAINYSTIEYTRFSGGVSSKFLVPYSPTPVPVLNLANVKGLSASGSHNCALTMQGTVACWGRNALGQLGNGSSVDSQVPVMVTNLTGIKQISSGGGYACAITAQDSVSCWGTNGRIGNNAITNSTVPVLDIQAQEYKQVSFGWRHTCAITAQETVVCWGGNYAQQLGNNSGSRSDVPVPVENLTGVKQLHSGFEFSCAILEQGSVQCWGGRRPLTSVGNLLGVKQVSGFYSPCAITAQDTLTCWGLSATPSPVEIEGLSGVKQLSVTSSYSYALNDQGKVLRWKGRFSSSAPIEMTGLEGAKQIVSGRYGSCAITREDTVACWSQPAFIPLEIKNLKRVAKIKAIKKSFQVQQINSSSIYFWGNQSGFSSTPLELVIPE